MGANILAAVRPFLISRRCDDAIIQSIDDQLQLTVLAMYDGRMGLYLRHQSPSPRSAV
jgi:hypothetical protein